MKRIPATIAATVLLGLLATGGVSQPIPVGADIKVSREGGVEAWTTPAEGDTSTHALLSAYADWRDAGIITWKSMLPRVIKWGSRAGRTYAGPEIDTLVADVLEEHQHRLITQPSGLLTAIHRSSTSARQVTHEGLASAHATEWVMTLFRPRYADPLVVARQLQSPLTPGGLSHTFSGVIVLCERADRAREMLAAARKLDEESMPAFRAFDVPDGVDPLEVARTLEAQFSTRSKPWLVIHQIYKSRKLLVRALPTEMDAIADAVKALKN